MASRGASRALLRAAGRGDSLEKTGCPALGNELGEPEKSGAFLALERRREAGTGKGGMGFDLLWGGGVGV